MNDKYGNWSVGAAGIADVAKRLECAVFRRFWICPAEWKAKAPEYGALQTLRDIGARRPIVTGTLQ